MLFDNAWDHISRPCGPAIWSGKFRGGRLAAYCHYYEPHEIVEFQQI